MSPKKNLPFAILNAYDNWSNKAKEFEKEMPGTTFKVSDLIQNLAIKDEKESGLDIANFLIQLNWKDFRKGL